MSKKLLIMLVVISMVSFAFASPFSSARTIQTETKTPVSIVDGSTTVKNVAVNPSDDLFDEQFQFPCADASGEAGVETDGEYIYTTLWNAAGFVKYELDGTMVEVFTVAGAQNVRDLAYDGEFFYGGAAANTVFIMDFTNQTLVGTITAPVAVRAIAYDEAADGFWANNWSDAITLFDRNGNTVNSFAVGAHSSYYGFAYDGSSDGGPYLWGVSQDNNGSDLVQMEIATGQETGVVFDASIYSTTGTGIGGGLYTTDTLVPGYWTLGGIVQNETIYGLELGVAADPMAPGAPTDFVVTPNANGGLTADLGWFNPSVNIVGEPLTELTEVVVYINDEEVETFENPEIGGFMAYTANIPAAGMHSFKVQANNTYDNGGSASANAWVGEDVPNAITSAMAELNDPAIEVTWTNPTDGLHGGPFNLGVEEVKVVRNDGQEWILGAVESYTDNSVVSGSAYNYTIMAGNATGWGPAATTNTVFVGDGYVLPEFPEQAAYPNNPNPYDNSYTDLGWTEVVVTDAGIVSGSVDLMGTWESVDYYGEGSLWIQSPAGTALQVYAPTANGIVEDWTVSTDAFIGEDATGTWLVYIEDSFGDGGHAVHDGMMFVSVGVGEYGTIEGTVTLNGLTDNVEDVVVTAGNHTTNPDASGFYSFDELLVGTYDVMATLQGYAGDMVEGVEVVAGQTTTVDLTLQELDGYWTGVNDGTYLDAIGLTSGGTFSTAFLLEDFQVGDAISGIRFWLNELTTYGITAKVWASNNGTPGDVVYEEVITGYTPDMMSEHMFANSFVTTDAQYFVGYEVTHAASEFPAGLDEVVTAGYGDWIALDGEWDQLSVIAPGLGGDWLIDAFIGGGGTPPIMYGDVDGNGAVQGFDAALTLQNAVGMITFTPEQEIIADVDGNGSVQGFDASLILQYAVGIINVFPVEEMRNFSAPVADVKVTIENNELVFTTTGNLYGFDLVAEGIELASVVTEMQPAQNGNNVSVASAYAQEGEFLRVPFTAISGEIKLNMVVNTQEEVVVLSDAPKFNQFTGNYPNPFNPTTFFGVELAKDAKVSVNIYNIKGAKVDTIERTLGQGSHKIEWNADNSASGVYFYKVNIDGEVSNGKMLLLK